MNSRNDVGLFDDSADLVQHGLAHGDLLPDHRVIFVVRVVRVPQLTVARELELHELVPELALVADTVKRGSKEEYRYRSVANATITGTGGFQIGTTSIPPVEKKWVQDLGQNKFCKVLACTNFGSIILHNLDITA